MATVMAFLSIVTYFVNYAVYSDNGKGILGLVGVAQALDLISTFIFMLTVTVIAKGWAISSMRLSHRRTLVVVFSLVLVAYVGFFIWSQFYFSEESTLYIYESIPGYGVLTMRFVTLVYFLAELCRTYRSEEQKDKRTFYVVFGVFYTVWFLCLPVVVIIASLCSEWYRDKLITIINLTITTVAYSSLVFLLWPSRANKYFTIVPADILADVAYDVL
eukprot:TRINITY_DN865_c0_g1_i2.p1 TRINITY_DN865_c0_g1~~TRINITY_DN865_c0_g1_i2.p1  ORF type:complete len:217 (-),score=37.35 TRINITY_DN865_c0_g1_i2:70-720(-)